MEKTMNKKLLKLLFIFLILTLFISCKKENAETVEDKNIYDTYVKDDPNNIYHKKYTNVVKIQGRYVEKTNNSFYLTFGGREEGKYDKNYNIFEAIHFGSLQRVAEIIEADSSKIISAFESEEYEDEYNQFMDESYNINGANPLSFAVFYRDMGIIQYLLDNINDESALLQKDDDEWNAFAYACALGTVDIIKALIQKYPDFVNWENSYGANGLHMAALQGNIPTIDYLVNDLKIDINSTDSEGDGVLEYAKDEETKEALIRLGAERKNYDYDEDEEDY